MTRVFVTGASGLIGGALLTRLRACGDRVVALARGEATAAELAVAGAEVVRGDVLDELRLAEAMAGCELVFHVAGVNTLCPADPWELYAVNVRGAEIAVRAAARAGVRRVVLTSSAAVLGERQGTTGDEDSPHRGHFLSVYERSKSEGEAAALAAGRSAGIDVVAVLPASVQGAGRAGGTGRFLVALLDGRLKVFLDSWISLVDLRDCVEGHLLAAERGRPGRRYVLSGVAVSTADALAAVGEVTGLPVTPRVLPGRVALAAGAAAEAGFRAVGRPPPVCRAMVRTLLHGHRYDGSRATRELGLTYTPLEETLRATAQWAVDTGRVRRRLPGLAGRTPVEPVGPAR